MKTIILALILQVSSVTAQAGTTYYTGSVDGGEGFFAELKNLEVMVYVGGAQVETCGLWTYQDGHTDSFDFKFAREDDKISYQNEKVGTYSGSRISFNLKDEGDGYLNFNLSSNPSAKTFQNDYKSNEPGDASYSVSGIIEETPTHQLMEVCVP